MLFKPVWSHLIFFSLIGCSLFFSKIAAVDEISHNEELMQLLHLKKYQKTLTVFSFPLKVLLAKEEHNLEKKIGVSLGNKAFDKVWKIKFFLESVPLFIWQILSLVLLLMILFLVTFYRRRMILLTFLTISFFLLVKFIFHLKELHAPQFFVLTDQASLYSGPHDSYPVIATIKAGTSAQRLQHLNRFLRIKSPHACGWISSNNGEMF